MSITHQMIAVFCFIDDFLKANPNRAAWRKSNNDKPLFTDAEVLTIAQMQPLLGVPTLKRAYLLAKSLFARDFPHRPSYQGFIARLHRLAALEGMLMMRAAILAVGSGNIFLMDSKPIPLCKAIRHGRVRLLREAGAYFGKNAAGWYFGFKLHALAHADGTIIGAFLTPGNWNDRDVAAALCEGLEGESIVIADLGYRDSQELEPLLWEQYGVLLVTPFHAGPKLRALVCSVRERIETVFSCLWNRFVDVVYSRCFDGLWSAIKLKMLHYNLCKAGIVLPLDS